MGSLTIEGKTFSFPSDKWFHYTGSLKSCPSWFLDYLEDTPHKAMPTGAVHVHDPEFGSFSLYPDCIVLHNGNKWRVFQGVHGAINEETS